VYILGSDYEDVKLTDLLRIVSNGVLAVLSGGESIILSEADFILSAVFNNDFAM
jgi:hypothetical protein